MIGKQPAKLMPWRESTSGMKILLVVAVLSWIVGMVSLVALGGIETMALSQPRSPVGEYLHPRQIKGSSRYLTEMQNQVVTIVEPLFFSGLAIFVCAGAFYNRIQAQQEEKRKNAILDRFSAEHE
jgi:hypothetical protein